MIMRKIRDIIESPFPASTNSLWLNKGILKYYSNGMWVPLIGGEQTNLDLNNLKDTLELSKVATTGSYKDLKDTPSVVDSKANGLMSISLYQKLNGIEAQANKYILPEATIDNIGGVKQLNNISKLTGAEDISGVITKINELLENLHSSKIMK